MRFSCLCRVRRADVAAAAIPALFAPCDDAAAAGEDSDDAAAAGEDSDNAAAANPALFAPCDDAAAAGEDSEESDAAAISLSEDDRLEL